MSPRPSRSPRLARFGSLALAAALLVASTACTKPSTEGTPPAPSAATSAPSTGGEGGAPAASAAPAKTGGPATYEGTYTTSAVTAITVPEGAKWKGEEGQEGVGEGKLSLEIAADGRVTGTVVGALGAGVVEGQRDGDTVTGTIRRKDPADLGFYGTLAGKIAGDKVEGTLSASRANAGLVREGKFTLGKK